MLQKETSICKILQNICVNVYDAHYYQEQWYLGWGGRDDSSNLYDTKRLTNFKTKNMYHYSVTNAWYVNGNPYGFCYPIGGWSNPMRWPTSTVYMNNHILTSRLQIYLNNKKINRSMIVAGTSYNTPDTTELDGNMNGMYSCVRNKTYLLRNHRLIYWVRTFYVVFCEEAGYDDRMCCYPYNSPYIYMSSLGWR